MFRNQLAVSLLLVAASLALSSREARGDKWYVGPLNGVWSDPANWSDTQGGPGGGGVPGGTDNVFFSYADGASRALTLDTGPVILNLTISNVGGGTNTILQGGGFNLSSAYESISARGGGQAAHVHLSGLNSTGGLFVGAGGAYTMGGGTLEASVLSVDAYYGAATFEQNGGTVRSLNGIWVDGSIDSTGTYLLNGGTLLAGALSVGGSVRGAFIHLDGIFVTSRIEIGRSTWNGRGTYTLSGNGATLIVNGHEIVGYRGASAHFSQSAGSHWVGGNLTVGDIGGTGDYSYHMSGGSLTVIGGLKNNDYSSRGVFLQTGGDVTVGTPEAPKRMQMKHYEIGPGASMYVSGSVTLGSYIQTGGSFVSEDSFYAGGGESSISEGTLTVHGREFYSGTFNQTGGSVSFPSPSFRSVYTTYYFAGGTYTSPRLSPSRTFYWSGGDLNLSTLELLGRTVVTQDSGRTLVVNEIVRPNPLQFSSIGTLDLTNNNAIIDYVGDPQSQILDVREFLAKENLISSTADPAHRLGYADNADPPLQKSTFSGETFPAGDFSQLLIMYTFGGDANLDGAVNLIDLAALATHWQATGAFWVEGDFNYDGLVNHADLGILATNWNTSQAVLDASLVQHGLPAVAIPEPAMLGVGMFIFTIGGRRRRQVGHA